MTNSEKINKDINDLLFKADKCGMVGSRDFVKLIEIVSLIFNTLNPSETYVDLVPPTITLIGSNPQIIQKGSSYIELGATATDNVSGNVTSSIVVNSSSVNSNTLGNYVVTYNVNDAAGNPAIQATRQVQIVDTTVPVITLIGSNPQSITIGSDYVELGATATDLQDGNISSEIVINSSTVNTGTIGSYLVTYNVSDSNGKNAVQVTRTVNIVAVIVPPLSSPKVYYGQVISGTSINQALVDLITPNNSVYVAPSVRAFRQEIATGITTSYSLFWDGNSPNTDKNTQFIAIPSSSHVLNSVNSDAFGGENYHTNGGATVYSSSTDVLNGVNYTVYKYTSIAPSNSNLTISITNN